jgi:hypothetical protein
MPVVMLTVFPRPTDPVLNKTPLRPFSLDYSFLAPETSHRTRKLIYHFTIASLPFSSTISRPH